MFSPEEDCIAFKSFSKSIPTMKIYHPQKSLLLTELTRLVGKEKCGEHNIPEL